MDRCAEHHKKKCNRNVDKKIRRFSKIENEKNAPFFEFYNPLPDCVLKQEKRKMKPTEHPLKKPKPKLKMKCISCKDKKTKQIEIEEKKIEKYIAPITNRQLRENEERHKKEKQRYYVCKKEIIRMPSPIEVSDVDGRKKMEYESALKDEKRKVIPEKISMTESTMKWPPDPTFEELVSKVPKSKIYINKTKKKGAEKKYPLVDSFEFIYNEKYRQRYPWYEMYRGRDSLSFFPDAPAPSTMISEAEAEGEEKIDEELKEEITLRIYNEYEGEEKLNDDIKNDDSDDNADYDDSAVHFSPYMKPISTLDVSIRASNKTKDVKRTEREIEIEPVRLGVPGTKSEDDVKDGSKDEDEIKDEEEGESVPSYMEKVSAATSITSEYKLKYPADDQYDTNSMVPSVINQILQKYQGDSEVEVAKKEHQPFQRGTLKSHSTTKVPSKPKSFYFGVRNGTFHYADKHFSEKSRYKQGLSMCVTAYVMSFIKSPQKWKAKDIDMALDLGDKLYLKSLEVLHLHDEPRILQPEELYDVVEVLDKRIKYKIDEPDIAGFTKSEDPKIFDLLKGLSLFFKRNRSGILQTYNTNILIWHQKQFFVFDPEPRTKELYSKDNGTAILASFYDLQSVMIMLLERGKIENWPYIISKISIKKITTVESKDDVVSITSDMKEESLFQIINPNKAIIRAAFNIDDDCFGETRNRQAVAVAIVALVYSHVTPACAWHKRTVNKILMIANQFFIECIKDTDLTELKLENIPAFFTIGPLMIEVTIYANQYAGLMYRKAECLFESLLTKFFCSNTSAIIEIDQYSFAVWKNRGVFYCFDPYPRDHEGLRTKDGLACVTMNGNLQILIDNILFNYNVKSYVFKIHILKVIKIGHDPQFPKVPRNFFNSEESLIENIKISDKRAYVEKNITVDRAELAAKNTFLEEPLDPSIVDVASFVGSIDQKFVPEIPICSTKAVVKYVPPVVQKIIDLDSPSLSETQIEKDKPSPLRKGSYEFRLLEEIMKEEMELNKLMELSGEGGEEEYLELIKDFSFESSVEMEDEMVQKGVDYGIVDKKSELINTDLLGVFPIPRIVMEPNKPPRKHDKHKAKSQKKVVEDIIAITQSAELAKPSNFISLPDGSEILYGSKNIANLGEDFNNASPFVCTIAVVMGKKYTLNTWSQEVVDAILDYGYAVYKSVGIKFSDVPKIDIPKITIGSNSFHVVIDYLFDSLLAQSILEQCLEKLVFRDKEASIVVTQNYSCAVFFKRELYYMFDPFGNNLVGLGEGPDNTGVSGMFRFTSLYALVSRFLYNKRQRENIEPTEASRFIISTVDVKVIFPASLEKIPRREKQLGNRKEEPQFVTNPEEIEKKEDKELKPKNKVGYQSSGNYMLIEGSDVLKGREDGEGKIKQCHFVCICALIGIFGRPIKTWDTKRIDYVNKMGKTLFGYVDNINFADKRNIRNLLFDKYFFDIIVKRFVVANQKIVKNFTYALDHMLIKNKFLIIQFPNCCYVLYKGAKKMFHLFDPYGVDKEDPKTCWIKFQNKQLLLKYLRSNQKDSINTFLFYTINISHLKKASKKNRLEYKLRVSLVKKKKKHKSIKIFHESEDWLTEYPIPWSRMKKQVAAGIPRGSLSHKWFNWDVEYPGDLYSITATKHQCSTDFPSRSRNKQTLANCIVAIIMTEVYDFTEWNSQIMDSILQDGDLYFRETFRKNREKNYEIKLEDFPLNVNVFPYNVNIDLFPLIEGTMFVVRPQQFNLSKALRYFFEAQENRCGIICCNNGRSKTKYVAYGRIRENEYFMYDCQTIGPPMYIDRYSSKAYMLRCISLNRLIHVITMTLRGGDFFIYYVGISEEQAEQVIKVDNLEVDIAGKNNADLKSQGAEEVESAEDIKEIKVNAEESKGTAEPEESKGTAEPEEAQETNDTQEPEKELSEKVYEAEIAGAEEG